MDRTVCLAGLSIKRAIFMDGTVSLLHLSTERGVSVDTRAKLWPLCSAALCLSAVGPHQRGGVVVCGQGHQVRRTIHLQQQLKTIPTGLLYVAGVGIVCDLSSYALHRPKLRCSFFQHTRTIFKFPMPVANNLSFSFCIISIVVIHLIKQINPEI